MMLSDVCLSVAYIMPKSRTERPRKTKMGTEVAHITHDLDTTFKVKLSKVKVTMPLYSQRHLHIRQLQRSSWEHIQHGNPRLRCRLQARQLAWQRESLWHPQREKREGGISRRPPTFSLLIMALFTQYRVHMIRISRLLLTQTVEHLKFCGRHRTTLCSIVDMNGKRPLNHGITTLQFLHCPINFHESY